MSFFALLKRPNDSDLELSRVKVAAVAILVVVTCLVAWRKGKRKKEASVRSETLK